VRPSYVVPVWSSLQKGRSSQGRTEDPRARDLRAEQGHASTNSSGPSWLGRRPIAPRECNRPHLSSIGRRVHSNIRADIKIGPGLRSEHPVRAHQSAIPEDPGCQGRAVPSSADHADRPTRPKLPTTLFSTAVHCSVCRGTIRYADLRASGMESRKSTPADPESSYEGPSWWPNAYS